MKIYTRSGDKGETGLLGAIRVPKSHLVIEVSGTVDEVNCILGCAIAEMNRLDQSEDDPDPGKVLTQIQSELFDLGSRVAASLSTETKTAPVQLDPKSIERLEGWIDGFDSQLPPLQNFILPSGSPAGCQLHLARTVCRRAERRLVSLMESGIERDLSSDLIYLNRLSDLLFVMARFANQTAGCTETPWTASS